MIRLFLSQYIQSARQYGLFLAARTAFRDGASDTGFISTAMSIRVTVARKRADLLHESFRGFLFQAFGFLAWL
jgi:hypothetical protein